MLAALTLAAAATSLVSSSIHLHCFVGDDVEANRFSLLIDRKAGSITVSSNHLGPTTIPAWIKPGLIMGRGPIHYNLTTYEITIPKLTVRVTSIPHIWPGPTPKLVSEGRCAQTSPAE